MHYDGTSWTANSPPGVTTNLNGIWGSGPFDIWVVGDARVIRRWNGTAWSVRAPADPDAANLTGVWGSSASDVWISATTNKIPAESHVLHISFTDNKEYISSSNAPTFDAIWGTSASNVWVLGSSVNAGLGVAINVVAGVSPSASYSMPRRMRSIWGASAQDVWAVGEGGVQMRWNGTAWTQAATRTGQNLNAVWGLSTSNVWSVGDLGPRLLYDGQNWTVAESGTRNNLLSLWGATEKDVWAVGFAGSMLRAQK